MKNTLVTLSTVVALSVSSYAGGKYVEPESAPIAPIIETVNPLPLYIGVGLVAAGLSRDCPCANSDRLKDTTYGGLLRVGWDFNQYIGIEARYLNASIEEDFSKTTHYGLFVKPQYHVMNQMNVYGLVGYGKTSIDYDNHNGKSSTLDTNGFSYGIGFEYDFGSDESQGQYGRMFDGQGDQEKGWGIWADYQHLLNDEDLFNTDSNIFSVGVTYDF